MDRDELLKQIEFFKTFKQRRWKSWRTKRNNSYYFRMLLDFIEERPFTRENLLAFFNWLETQGLAESVRRQAETCMLAFTRFLHYQGVTSQNIGREIERTEIHRKPHMLPSSTEVAKFIRQVTRPGRYDNRLTSFSKMEHRWCLLFIVFACGGRNYETSMISRKDVSLSSREIEIVHGKNGPRIVGIPKIPWLVRELKRRVAGRNKKELDVLKDRSHFKEEYIDRLFVVSEKKMEETMRKVGELFGRSMTVHDLRRIFARDMKANGADIDDIRIAMGHKDIKTTLQYLYDDPSDIKRVLDTYSSEARKYRTPEEKANELITKAMEYGSLISDSGFKDGVVTLKVKIL